MPLIVYCPCGQPLRLSTGRVVCPSCDRMHLVLGGGRAVPLAVSLVCIFAVISIGLLGALVGASRPSTVQVPSPKPPANMEPREPVKAILPQPPEELPERDGPELNRELPPAADPLPEQPPVPPPPAPAPPDVAPVLPRAGALESTIEPAGRYRIGETIRQNVLFRRIARYEVSGLELSSNAEYRIESRIEIIRVNTDGTMVARQTIVSVQLLHADPEMKQNLTTALEQLLGTHFDIHVEPNGRVKSISGVKHTIQVHSAQAGNETDPTRLLRVWSLMDGDAWKELAEWTFFQPDKPLKPKTVWSRPMSHDWGAMGRWNGNTVFAAAGKRPGRAQLELIEFRNDLNYEPPNPKNTNQERPFRLDRADLRTTAAGGSILFDPQTSRTTAADELFQIRGSLIVMLNGLQVPLVIEERQTFQMEISELKQRDLVGRVPPPAHTKK